MAMQEALRNDVRVGPLNMGKREHRLREAAELIVASELRDDYAVLNSSNIQQYSSGVMETVVFIIP
jgi:hypothetical protein